MTDLRRALEVAVARLPPSLQLAGIARWRKIKRSRRMLAERVGSRRYSRPGLFDLDRKLAAFLPSQGVFVEAGANDGYRQSNTYYLERWCGWTGLLIEPIPWLAGEARRDRKASVVCAALVPPDYRESTIQIQASGLHSAVAGTRIGHGFGEVERQIRVPARTISDILDEAGVDKIDLLSLDVEGYEVPALKGLTRHRPEFILVEIDEGRGEVEDVLGARYTMVAQLSFHDYLYELRE